jgi:hypothetical protein
MLVLATWGVLYLLQDAQLSLTTTALPIFVISWMLVRPEPSQLYRFLAWLGLITAAFSIGFGLISPLAFMSTDWTANAEKALIGDEILAGPYSHSNALGLALALTLPFVVLHFKRYARLAAVIVVGVALLWSASRLSTAAAVFALLVSLLVLRLSPRASRRLLSISIVSICVLLIMLPLLTTDPSLFTKRGMIWMTSLAHVGNGSWFIGEGGDAFREVNSLTTALGFVSTTGHNVFVTFFATGGVVTVFLMAIVLLIAYLNGRRAYATDQYRLLFLAILLVLCIAEDPVRALALGPQSFVIYPMLLVMLDSTGVAQPWKAPPSAT